VKELDRVEKFHGTGSPRGDGALSPSPDGFTSRTVRVVDILALGRLGIEAASGALFSTTTGFRRGRWDSAPITRSWELFPKSIDRI
jgi:hypothetical protein